MLVSKEKHPDGKGFKCTYDKPRTPYQRVLDEHVLTPEQETALMAYKTRLSGMELYRRVVKRLRRIRRMQTAYDKAKHAGEDLSPFAARPSAPGNPIASRRANPVAAARWGEASRRAVCLNKTEEAVAKHLFAFATWR